MMDRHLIFHANMGSPIFSPLKKCRKMLCDGGGGGGTIVVCSRNAMARGKVCREIGPHLL